MHRIAKQIHNEILKANKILLIPHQNPDGDALGSMSAVCYYLENLKKPYSTFCLTSTSEKLIKLPHLIKASTSDSVWQNEDHDLIIVLDSGDLRYAGVDKYVKSASHEPIIINIDHHATNSHFGQHNLIIPKASSTAEILYLFFRSNKIAINKNIALSLLTGLITDTENFTNPGTTINALKIASELIRSGADFNYLKTWFLQDKSIITLKLWGLVFSRLNRHEKFDIAYTFLTQADLKKHQASESEIEGVANFMNNLSDGKASIFLRETNEGKIKGSLRTTSNNFDVSQIAKTFNGGGHKKASGFTVDGSIDDVFKKIWETLQSMEK